MASERHRETEESGSFVRFIVWATVVVVLMGLFVLSGSFFYTAMLNLSLQGGVMSYVAYFGFLAYFVALAVLAGIVAWLRGKRSSE